MKRKGISSIYGLFEGRGSGGPTVTVHLPQKLAEDLLHVLYEALEVSGDDLPGEDEEELADDEDELDADFDDGEGSGEDAFPGLEGPGAEKAEDEDEEDEDLDEDGGSFQDSGASKQGLNDKGMGESRSRALSAAVGVGRRNR